MKNQPVIRVKKLSLAIATVLTASCLSNLAIAQEQEENAIEEVIATGTRLQGSAAAVVEERKNQAFVADIMGAEQISRTGDGDAAAALRRVTGLTLVDGKFIYIRGLGERYSSTQLNGATVPTPDLTRNVVPLDMFPSSIIESLAVQKAYSPDMPAAFGGGNIDIRTRSLPKEPLMQLQLGTGWNTESSDDGISYKGGDKDWYGEDDGTRAFPAELSAAINTYRGNISAFNIQTTINNADSDASNDISLADAETINRQMATYVYRDIELNKQKSLSPDINAKFSYGNSWDLDNDLEFGILFGSAYKNQWRNQNTSRLSGQSSSEVAETTNNVQLTGALSLGLNYRNDHKLQLTSMLLRDSEDEVQETIKYDATFNGDLRQHNYGIRYEQRQLLVNQLSGKHNLPFWGMGFDWYYSDSKATTDIPNQITYEGQDNLTDGEWVESSKSLPTAARFQFTELTDDVESYGWDLTLPIYTGKWEMEFAGGYDYSKKSRSYYANSLNISTSNTSREALTGLPEDVYSDENILNPDNGMSVTLGSASGFESYLAGQIVEAGYGKFDVLWDGTWRLSGGARWEQFSQASLPINILEFDPAIGQSGIPDDELENATFKEDSFYPSLSLTYIHSPGFQLRAGVGRTVVRPDIREVSSVDYRDPLTDFSVVGNSDLKTSDIDNFDLRAEWFMDNGDNVTISLFYKDITNPIETIQTPGSDDNIVLTFTNAETAEIYGIEAEWLHDLSYLGDWASGFFTSGNITLSDSEIDLTNVDVDVTNKKRAMTGHSEYVANFQLGFDSADGYHSANLVYNVFGERIFFAGRSGASDTLEQPFHSLDAVYTYYPNFNTKINIKVKNLLGENKQIEEQDTGVIIFDREVGTSFSIDFTYDF